MAINCGYYAIDSEEVCLNLRLDKELFSGIYRQKRRCN